MIEFFKTLWGNASAIGRTVFFAGCVLIVLLAVGLFWWSGRTDYQPLFTDMAEQDMSSVVAALDKEKIPYQISQDGKSVLVDKATVYKTRMKLLGGGLPLHGGVGLELFNNSEFGMTEFAQKVNYQRALQGELARTIQGFDEVQSARVLLVLPENGLLRRRGTAAKASVWVTLRNGSVLTPAQVSGIQWLVAASAPEIEPSTVTVVDQRGVALSTNNQYGDGFYAGNANLQLKKEVETYFSGKIADVLDEVLGPGKAAIAVDATIDYGQVQTTRETILPADNKQTGVLVRQKEKTSGSDPVPVSTITASSADAALPVVVATPSSKMLEADYQTGREIQQIATSPGTIKRLSVGIVMPQKLPDATIERLQQVIGAAVGLDAARGDAIVFSSMNPLSAPADSATTPSAGGQANNPFLLNNQQLLAAGGAALIAVVLLIVVALLMRRRRPAAPPPLSADERERLLVHVRQWLNDETPAREPVHEQP